MAVWCPFRRPITQAAFSRLFNFRAKTLVAVSEHIVQLNLPRADAWIVLTSQPLQSCVLPSIPAPVRLAFITLIGLCHLGALLNSDYTLATAPGRNDKLTSLLWRYLHPRFRSRFRSHGARTSCHSWLPHGESPATEFPPSVFSFAQNAYEDWREGRP